MPVPLDASRPDPAARVAVPPPPVRPRFTLDGDADLEAHLAATCARIAAGLRGLLPARRLEAVLLGGGYGRGEGGVLRTPAGDQPYNDLEFYVCLRGSRHLNQQWHGRALHVLGEILTPQAGLDVEFHITSLSELVAADTSMFSYDLVSGHRWLLGDEPLLAGCEHHRHAELIPIAEASRLLMNRCSGLLFAAERLERTAFTAADADFVARNVAKAQLGAGDAVLTTYGQYHWSVRERQRRLERLARLERRPWLDDLVRHHAFGVDFKLHPTRSAASRGELAVQHAHVSDLCRETWLWVESRRLNERFRSLHEYVTRGGTLWPEASGARNLLVNAKVLGFPLATRSHPWRHPRDRILRALPMLLWLRDVLAAAESRRVVQRHLGTTAGDFAGLATAYRTLWSKVN